MPLIATKLSVPLFQTILRLYDKFRGPGPNGLWPVIPFSGPFQARVATYVSDCLVSPVTTAKVSSLIISKHHENHISGWSGWPRHNLNQWHLLKVISSHLALHGYFTSHGNKKVWCRWSRCAQLVKTNRLIWILTFFGQHLTVMSRDLRSNFGLCLSGSTGM